MSQLILINEVAKKYDEGSPALETISLSIPEGERLGIVGETGSGKSTLLRIMAGLIQPDSGSVYFINERILGPDEKLVPGHAEIAYLSQHFELPKFITVFQHLDDPYLIDAESAQKIYASCQILHLLDKDTRALSGGEKQRVALAKLLLRSPKLLLLDEPFSNLDFNHKRIIKQVIEDVEKLLGTTVVLVAHDPLDVLSWADRILVFRNGTVVQEGSSKVMYNEPANAYVAGLFGAYNEVTPSQWGLKRKEKKIIVRPEAIRIGKNGHTVDGIVKQVRYYGHFEELQVATAQDVVFIQTPVGKYKEKDVLSMHLLLV
jgi:iron(III) transport system ATP-binding protein